MNRRRTLLLVIVGLGLGCGILFLFWRQSAQSLHLRIVRRAVEQGKPVVFFRVEGVENRWVAINDVFKIEGDKIEGTLVEETGGLLARAPDFWAPSQAEIPLADMHAGRKEFGVTAPTNVPAWRLRVAVVIEDPHSFMRFRTLFSMWRLAGTESAKSMRATAASVWNATYTRPIIIESNPITNTVAPEAFSKAMQ
jgi:hypothetical protein